MGKWIGKRGKGGSGEFEVAQVSTTGIYVSFLGLLMETWDMWPRHLLWITDYCAV